MSAGGEGGSAGAGHGGVPGEDEILAEIGHPKGTLAVMAVYMLLFVAGWILLYFFLFLPRGGSHL